MYDKCVSRTDRNPPNILDFMITTQKKGTSLLGTACFGIFCIKIDLGTLAVASCNNPNKQEALLSQRGRAMFRVCIASIQNVDRNLLLLVVSASHIPLRTIKFLSVFFYFRRIGPCCRRSQTNIRR